MKSPEDGNSKRISRRFETFSGTKYLDKPSPKK